MKAKQVTGSTITNYGRKPGFILTRNQRYNLKMAKVQNKTNRSAINEIGKTVRDVAGQITAQKAYQTYANKEVAKERTKANNDANLSTAVALYNKIISGNAEQEGASGKESTTQVGSGGSAIGG